MQVDRPPFYFLKNIWSWCQRKELLLFPTHELLTTCHSITQNNNYKTDFWRVKQLHVIHRHTQLQFTTVLNTSTRNRHKQISVTLMKCKIKVKEELLEIQASLAKVKRVQNLLGSNKTLHNGERIYGISDSSTPLLILRFLDPIHQLHIQPCRSYKVPTVSSH